jgi:hypothetical protein
MKKRFSFAFALIVLVLASPLVNGQDNTFVRRYFDLKEGYPDANGYTLFSAIGNDVVMLRTAASGDVDWCRSYNYDSTGTLDKVSTVRTSANDFVVAATWNESSFSRATRLFKVDPSGVVKWSHEIDFAGERTALVRRVIESSDKGYVLLGRTDSMQLPGPSGQSYEFIMKTDSVGNVLWIKGFHDYGPGYFFHYVTEGDDGFIISAERILYPAMVIIKTDLSGNITWSNEALDFYTVGGTPVKYSGGYLIPATNNMQGQFPEVLHLNQTHDSIKAHRVVTLSYGVIYDLKKDNDGGFLITGYANTPNYGGCDRSFVTKLDPILNISWTKIHGIETGTGWDLFSESRDIKPMPDGGYMLAGTYFVKTDSAGSSGCFSASETYTKERGQRGVFDYGFTSDTLTGASIPAVIVSAAVEASNTLYCFTGEEEISPGIEGGLRIYPNPSSGAITIRMNEVMQGDVSMSLYNTLGGLILACTLDDKEKQ